MPRPFRSLVPCLAPAIFLAACARSTPEGFDAAAPEGRIPAIIDAARTGDRAAIPDLIGQLDSDDPAVRMFAIRTLERLTDRTFGYDHAAPERLRRPAVDRWTAWYDAAMPDDPTLEHADGSHRP